MGAFLLTFLQIGFKCNQLVNAYFDFYIFLYVNIGINKFVDFHCTAFTLYVFFSLDLIYARQFKFIIIYDYIAAEPNSACQFEFRKEFFIYFPFFFESDS